MADNAKSEDTKAAEVAKAKEHAAAEEAAKAADADAKKATKEAQKQDLETVRQQEELVPYPSQAEADRIKAAAASGAAPYLTRNAKA